MPEDSWKGTAAGPYKSIEKGKRASKGMPIRIKTRYMSKSGSEGGSDAGIDVALF